MSAVCGKAAVDLEVLVDIEQQFYDAGYRDGVGHGKIHGRIEGRELGRDKGFEMWEELGFYEGFAKFWMAAAEHKEGKESRASHNAQLLLSLIAQFPMENPTHTDSEDIDIPKLFGQIRARYKMLCAIIGFKPNLRASQTQIRGSTSAAENDEATLASSKKASVWATESPADSGRVDFSF